MPVSRLESTRNERIKWLHALQERKYRRMYQAFLVEGDHCVLEAAASAFPFTHILVEENATERYADVIRRYEANAEVYIVPQSVLDFVCDTVTPQKIAGALPGIVKKPPQRYESSFFAALDGLQDPGNLGTILRTADAAGADFLLIGDTCADPEGGKAVRASMGSLFHIPVYRTPNLAEEIARLVCEGWTVYSAQLDGAPFFEREPVSGRKGLVIGSEGSGVSQGVAEACSHKLKLPMAGKAESLNAAVAAGIMLYDMAFRKEK